jgi:hypothetical protein
MMEVADEKQTSQEMLEAPHCALDEVDRRLAAGEFDGSGRFYTDEELVSGAATGRPKKAEPKAKSPAA